MLAADVQQFYCFEVLSEMLDRLSPQPTLLALRKRSWLKSAKIQSSHRRCFFGLVSFVSTIAFAYNQLHFNYGQYNEI